MILIANPVASTVLVALVLVAVILATSRKKDYTALFPAKLSNELKGFAIMAIVFAHIGYLLVTPDSFLWPLSILAGVGVNLFLFLSGYGLTLSAIKKRPTAASTAKRLLKLFVPLWIVLILYYLLDYFVLGTAYSTDYMAKSFGGLFLRADAAQDVNSVLWYFSVVLFYYIVFPLVFIRRYIWLSALGLITLSTIIVFQDPVRLHDVMRLYQVHILAFPIGMLVAWFVTDHRNKLQIFDTAKKYFNARLPKKSMLMKEAVHAGALAVLLLAIGYSAVHSSVDAQPLLEQLSSLLTMFLIIILFIIKRFEIGLFMVFGLVSFEVYLLHWPLMSRYDVLYAHAPAWLATVTYFGVILLLGYVLHKLTTIILTRLGVTARKNSN